MKKKGLKQQANTEDNTYNNNDNCYGLKVRLLLLPLLSQQSEYNEDRRRRRKKGEVKLDQALSRSNLLIDISGGDDTALFFIFTGVTGAMGALMDNVLAVATFIPVVNDMTDLGIYNYPLWWGLLFGATFFGNLTLIGSTANIVALGMLERQKHVQIQLLQWIKAGAIISIPTLLVAMLLLYLQIPVMPR